MGSSEWIKRHIFLLLRVFLFLISLWDLAGSDNRIMLAIGNTEDKGNETLNSIISDSIGLGLIYRNFDVSSTDLNSREKLLKESVKNQASYLVEGHALLVEDTIQLSLMCFRIADTALLYTEDFEFLIDLNLDDSIQDQVETMIKAMENDIDANPQMVNPIISDDLLPEKKHPLILSGGFSLYIPVADSRSYFTMGYESVLQVHYPLFFPFGYIGLGWNFSLNALHAKGELNSSKNLFLSTGPSLCKKHGSYFQPVSETRRWSNAAYAKQE